ncbi:putative RNA-dependent RNA polymerase 1 [Cinnamomum micranthum f. kanehirae]|uniref:RNA-dependent RNA polymerase n=1 Tax=Cinnamomum micranthum f. kanehirae TaxID=337451 RepID=A0A443NM34_9MAGN|nr:putative RNA-dependent RNA polymerase 1 [Cinnamomum micranthum f. kanehirae]
MTSSTVRLSGFDRAVSKEEVKKFLEDITGKDTVVEIKPGLPKNTVPKLRVFVIVQFTASGFAEVISSQAKQRLLWYEGSYLTVRQEKRDIIQRSTISKLQNAVLHVGCMVSAERFSSLWSVADVRVSFEFRWQKLQILLSYNGLKYKLEVLDHNIRQIQLHHQPGQATKFLLIQVRAAPRVYKKDAPEDHWDRTVDFTPQCSIGQSSALCLEVPYSCELPDLRKNFIYFKENEGQFILVEGSSYCNSFDLVPIVTPDQNIELPYSILFKINSLVQNGIIMGPTLNDEFFSLLNPCSTNNQYIDHALEALAHLKETCFEPTRWLQEQYRTFEISGRLPKLPAVSLDPGLVYIHRVQVTPTKVYFCGPEVNSSNRVLRQFSDDLENFIRISFVDEDWDNIQPMGLIRRTAPADVERYTSVYERILSTLRNGIVIGDKKFEFLTFSSSQIKENSTWMFASRSGLTAADIRKWMGDFSKIRNVAKYAARLGQSFGSSKETFSVMKNEIEGIPDIKTRDQKYNFSDGIGKISADFAERVASKCGLSSTPSAFQIRYAGYKGVVACDPKSSYKLSLRDSMCKYKSENTTLDVLDWSKYRPCFLNRQVITLLSTLGIEDRVFVMKQQQVVHQLGKILTDPVKAQEALDVMSPSENSIVLKEMLRCGYRPKVEPYLSIMLQTLRASKLWELRTKTKIFVPDARLMMGCLDETRTLKYGQVFVNLSRVGCKRFYDHGHDDDAAHGIQLDSSFVLVGKVFVAKNPCLYPGDLRVLFAVDVPALHHMVDCVVFPQKGKRPHPNECSGSDLDGDLYVVSWDPLLLPPRQIPPMEYMPAPTTTLDHDVKIEEVMEYFAKFMVNNSVGVISNAHLVWSDKEPLMAESEPCKELAVQSSIAVDYAKTGVPPEFPPHLHVKEYPDFMEKPNRPTYKSKRVIGKLLGLILNSNKLFRAIKNIATPTVRVQSFTKEDAGKTYDPDMEVEGFENYIEDAVWHKEQYGIKLCNLMEYYGIETEAEIVSGNLLQMKKSYTKKKDGETIALAMKTLTKEVRKWFYEKGSRTDDDVADDVYAKASAWYHVTYHPDYFNEETNRAHFFSFPWCVYEILIHIKKKKLELTGAAE